MTHRTIYRLLISGVLLLLIGAVAELLHWRDLSDVRAGFNGPGASIALLELAIVLIYVAAGGYAWPGSDPPLSTNLWRIGLAGYGLLRAGYVLALADHPIVWRIALHLPLTLVLVPLMLWLMMRYSQVAPHWYVTAMPVLTGWVLMVGVLLCIDTQSLAQWVRWLIAGVIVLAHVVIAAHCYLGLSRGDPQQHTLAAHWHGQATLVLLVMTGFFGAVRAISGGTLADTWLGTLPEMGKLAALVALALGLVNQIVAEMRGQSWRVTGLMPLWLIAAGWWLWLFTLAAIGLTQFMMKRTGLPQSADQFNALLPFAVGAWVLILVGMIVYGLGLYARRVQFDGES